MTAANRRSPTSSARVASVAVSTSFVSSAIFTAASAAVAKSKPTFAARLPTFSARISAGSGRGTLRAANDRYLQKARYCRLKNISLGYTLPQQITRKAHIEKLRIYVSGENLFFWSPLKKYAKNYDPEMITAGDADFASKTGTDGQGYGYPMTRSVTIGLNINF